MLYTLVVYACLAGAQMGDPDKCRSIEMDPARQDVCQAMLRLATASLEEDDYVVFGLCAPTARKMEARR
jgi:hypothetical protein